MEGLSPLIRNYASRLYCLYGTADARRYEIQVGVWKFNQYFNILRAWKRATGASGQRVCPQDGKAGDKGDERVEGGDRLRSVHPCGRDEPDDRGDRESGCHRRVPGPYTDPKSKYVTDYQSRILAPTRRVEMPYLIRGLTSGL